MAFDGWRWYWSDRKWLDTRILWALERVQFRIALIRALWRERLNRR